MNEIRLNRLSLRDFQGGTINLVADGKDLFIFGANEGGKTRLVSAFSWLLFNKDALDRSDFEIKNLDAQGEAAHGLEHSVEGEFSINGSLKILRKVYKEKWAKKRGSANREFTGHTTEYFIDGVPVQEKDYNASIAEMTGDELRFKLLTSPTVFPNLPAERGIPGWQRQRAILLEVCGDISDEDVIRSDDKLIPLLDILKKRSSSKKPMDDYREVIKARRSEINREMEKIPVRIDEVRRGFPDVTGIDRKASEDEIQGLETALNDAKLRLQGVNTGGNIADLSKRLSGLNADLRKLEEAHRSVSLSTLNRLNQKISEIGVQVGTSRRKIEAINADLHGREVTIKSADENLIKLREQWLSIDGEIFKEIIADICPACGQALPADRVQEARGKALAAFNENKAQRLKDVNERGMILKEREDRLRLEIDALEDEKHNIEESLPEDQLTLKQMTDERDALKQSSEDFSGIQGRADLLDEIEDIEAQIKAEREGKAQDIEKIKSEISTLQQKHAGALDRITMLNLKANGEKRMEELKAEEKKLSAEFEKLEGELYLMDQFIRTKVSMLTDRINSKFESGLPGLTVRFKLFNQLINKGIEECCEIMGNGIPFNAGLNNAARIQAGCVIIRTLQQHYGMKAPVFCDNRESVTNLPEMGCQVISLVVSPEDRELRIHLDGPGGLPSSTAMTRRRERMVT